MSEIPKQDSEEDKMTTESGVESEAVATQPTSAQVRSGGRGLAVLAMLLALVALGLAGWPWWLAWQDQAPSAGADRASDQAMRAELTAAMEARLDRLARAEAEQRQRLETRLTAQENLSEQRVTSLQRRLERSEESLDALANDVASQLVSLEQREADLEATVTGLRRAFSELATEVADAGPPDSQEWRIAEAAYLMRIANQRARLERDLRGAEALLGAADAILAELDDYSLVPVREALVEARAALAAQPAVDRVALYLELEALGLAVDALPVKGPEFQSLEHGASGTQAPGILAMLERRLTGLFEFRRHGGDVVRPLLTPDASFWHQHNIRLRLTQAQLALLRGEQDVWAGSLAGAADWLAEIPEAEGLAERAAALADRPVRVTAPDISEPLRRLDAARARLPLGTSP